MTTPEFDERVVQEAEKISPRGMGAGAASAEGQVSNPKAVAGLADSVKNAIAGMNRAKATADALAANASRLVGNMQQVDAINSQLTDANAQLEDAIAATDGPLESSTPAAAPVDGAQATQAPSAGAPSQGSGNPNAPHTSLEQQVNAAAQQAAQS